uniref:Uncharacterized protein n=1 Tax=Mus musculus TaxID=10090 RepID=Q8C6B6_MOUSE|nr:unnamed protein product [Mus musculus]
MRNAQRSRRRAYAASWRLSLCFGNWQDAITRKSHCPAPDSPDGDRSPRLTPSWTLRCSTVAALSTWLVRVKHTQQKGKKKKKKELGASSSGPRRRLHPHCLVPRATATPPVSPAPTLQVTRRTANFGLQRPLGTGRVQRPRAAHSLSQPRPCGLLQQRHAACVAPSRRWPSPAAFSLCGRRLQELAS